MTRNTQAAWLQAALDYVPEWLDFQVERYRQPGCTVAIADDEGLVAEWAFGEADMRTGKRMTPRHRLRIASHSKSFTAAGVLLLREQGALGLDDPIGRYVRGLHRDVAGARIGELLSHGAGITRDGDDSGQFADRRPFLSREELRAALTRKQPFAPGVQMKYSNHGYGLLGLMIEEIGGATYPAWITRHVIEAAGLRETAPDMPQLRKTAPMASGHSMEFPFGQRLVVPGDNTCDAIAPAGGFVATAADVARFFAQLGPQSRQSILSPASRREMARRRSRDEVNMLEMYYGLGTMLSGPGPREWAGHTGSLQGFVSRTARYSALGLTVTVLCNAQDGPSWQWVDGILSILEAFRKHGAPGRREAAWRGRWWNMWGANDFVPMGKVVCHVTPATHPPFDAMTTELALTGKDTAIVQRASAYSSVGQPAHVVRGRRGQATELWVGGSRLVSRDEMVEEVTGRYRKTRRAVRG